LPHRKTGCRYERSFSVSLPRKSEITEYWKTHLEVLDLFVDWGEPGCWACGFHYGDKYDVTRPTAKWAQILSRWDRVPLQRCHIIAKSLGGADTIDNLFLMCRECHDNQPNTSIPEIFFDWVRNQSHLRRTMTRLDEAFRSFGITESELPHILDCVKSEEFRRWAMERATLHFPQSGYAGWGRRTTFATTIGLARTYLALNQPQGPAVESTVPRPT
jgi:HNH endonuclease